MAWDLWLGPAPWSPYNARYYSRDFWSGHWDFAGGSITGPVVAGGTIYVLTDRGTVQALR